MKDKELFLNNEEENQPNSLFKEELVLLRHYLASKGLLVEVARRAGCKDRTVQYALSVNSPEELVGKKYLAYVAAVALKQEIEELTNRYSGNIKNSDG